MEANKTYFLDAMSTLINDDKLTSSFTKEITKYLQTFYIKQVIEMIDMKLLVKDTIFPMWICGYCACCSA